VRYKTNEATEGQDEGNGRFSLLSSMVHVFTFSYQCQHYIHTNFVVRPEIQPLINHIAIDAADVD
jgi:hypothetical protein